MTNKNIFINDSPKGERKPNFDTIEAFKEFDLIIKYPEKYKRYDSFSNVLNDLFLDEEDTLNV